MKPRLTPSEGNILRSIALYLSNGGGNAPADGIVVESVEARPWSSLTFAGERHRLILRLPAGTRPVALVEGGLDVAGTIIVVEHAGWAAEPDATVLTLDVLAIEDRYFFRA